MNKLNYILFVLFSLWGIALLGQVHNIGTPFLTTFSKKTYKAGTQNWDVIQDGRGMVYFANNEGMLQYDGKEWNCYALPNKTIVRSLALAPSGVIYAGGQNELGFYAPNKIGDWGFHSLVHLIPQNSQDFEDVWDIIVHEDGVFFRTTKKIYHFHENTISVYSASGGFNYLGELNGNIIVQDSKEGLKILKNGQLVLMKDGEAFTVSPLTGTFTLNANEWLVVTLSNGLFKYDGQRFLKWTSDADTFLKTNKIYASAIFANGNIALGTSLGGLLILNQKGDILFHLQKENGLLNNNILSLLVDREQHLWLGLDNGINYVLSNSPFTQIFPNGKAEGQGYDVQIVQNNIYFGTSSGVFYTQWDNARFLFGKIPFREIGSVKGQVWGFDYIHNDLFLAHHNGAFSINGNKIENISADLSVWQFNEVDISENLLIIGTYQGLCLLEKENGLWHFKHKIKGFNESSRFVEQDKAGNIWIAHPYKGIFKLKLDEKFENVEVQKYMYTDKQESNILKHVYKINEELVFCAENGVYLYDNQQDVFVSYEAYNRVFGKDTQVRRLFETPSGDIWYVTGDDVGVLNVQNKSLQKEIRRRSFPQLKELMVGGFELIYPVDENNVFIATQDGFLHLNPQKDNNSDSTFQVFLTQISNTNERDSTIFEGIFFQNDSTFLHGVQVSNTQLEHQIPTFNNEMNAFLFSFSATDYAASESVKFSYYLESMEENWGEWTTKREKEYTNLTPGNYTFHLKAINQNSIESPALMYQFVILSPWYATTTAKIIYLLLFIGIPIAAFWLFSFKYRKQKAKTKESEEEVIRLKNEQLLFKVANKNRELISTTAYLAHKNEIFAEIQIELEKIKKNSTNKDTSTALRQVINTLKIEENTDASWEQIIAHFNEIHNDFFKKLTKEFPELSPKDLKMCAFLRMNLSTKEIASLMNISIRGVEGARYRLRRKLLLDNKANLTDYILKV